MQFPSQDYLIDLAERVGWTAAQAVVSMLLVTVADWEYTWVPVLTAGLSVLKGVVARKIGDSESASTSPRIWSA